MCKLPFPQARVAVFFDFGSFASTASLGFLRRSSPHVTGVMSACGGRGNKWVGREEGLAQNLIAREQGRAGEWHHIGGITKSNNSIMEFRYG